MISPRSLYLRIHPLAKRIDSRVRSDWVIKRAALSNRYRYCYFRLPKCANSSVIKTLIYHDPEFSNFNVNISSQDLKQLYSNLLKSRNLTYEGFIKKYRTFTFVRNPYVRVLSAYLDKIASSRDDQYPYVAMSLDLKQANKATFSQFIYFLEQYGLYTNPHWAPQHLLLPINVDQLTWIGTVENIHIDLPRIIEGIWGDGSYHDIFSRQDKRQGAKRRLATYYTGDLAKKVYNLYQEDFRLFGYSEDLNKMLEM